MDGKSSGLKGAMKPENRVLKKYTAAPGFPAAVLLQLGTALIMGAWFPSGGAWWQLAGLMLVLSVPQWVLQGTKADRWVFPGGIALTALLCIAAGGAVRAGFGCMGNDLLQRLTLTDGRIHLDFAVAEEGNALWAELVLCAVVTLLMNRSVFSGSVLPALPVLLSVYAAVAAGLYPPDLGTAVLGIGAVLLLLRRTDLRGWTGNPAWMGVFLACVLVGTVLGLTLGKAEPRSPGAVVREILHDTFYHEDTNSMPEGNLRNLRGWKKKNTPALELTMTQPQKLYLRGRVYETYTGTAWEAADPELLAQKEDLFYWLHEGDFFGQSQIGTASAQLGGLDPQTLTVRNVGACGETGFYPYALLGTEALDVDRIGDAAFPEAEQLQYLTGSVPQWYALQQELARIQHQPGAAAYLAAAEAYEAYVTQANVQLTNESWSVLKRQLGDGVSSGTLSQIREFIREYLEDNVTYDEKESTPNGGGDFLQFTLEKAGYGYSVHYATAATLMLRYFGVPARYVEGYFLSGAEAEQYEPGEVILLTEEHAHAWAEYYLPGVGFIPFEVTPGYIDDEELELGGALAQSDRTYSGNHLQYAQVDQPERIEDPEQDRFRFAFRPVYLLWLMLAGLVVLLVLILKKRIRLKKALESIDSAPNREAIALRYGYAMKLLSSCGGARPEGSDEAARLNREALFSNHEMTARQRRTMDDFSRAALQCCRDTWTWRQKLRYRFWECLY